MTYTPLSPFTNSAVKCTRLLLAEILGELPEEMHADLNRALASGAHVALLYTVIEIGREKIDLIFVENEGNQRVVATVYCSEMH